MKRVAVFFSSFALLCSAVVFAAEPKPFTQKEFDTLTREGRSVVVDVYASWCPTCKIQHPIIEFLADEPAYRDVIVLVVDFDVDKAALKRLRVSTQSTLIAYRGAKETGRSVGDTTPGGIEKIFRLALQ